MKALILLTVISFIIYCNGTSVYGDTYSSLKCMTYAQNKPNYRTCILRNVCNIEGKWTMFLHESAKINMDGLPVNLGTYDSSPQFKIDQVRRESFKAFKNSPSVEFIKKPTFMYYAASTIYFHWLMDDLMGLFWMLQEHMHLGTELMDDNSVLDNQILLVDRRSPHSDMLQNLFTNNEVQLVNELTNGGTKNICFQNVFVGPAGHHIAGPGTAQVSTKDLYNFADFLKRRVGAAPAPTLKRPSITVVGRRENRIIVNQDQLVAILRKRYPQADVSSINLEELPLKEQIEVMQNTSLLVAMHGSAFANMIFMPQNSAVLELFPFGFDRPTNENLATKLQINYFKWKNDKKQKTVFHPEILDSFSLTPEKRSEIINSEAFQPTFGWAGNIYWINQDTTVDINALELQIGVILSSGDKKEPSQKKNYKTEL